MMHLFYNAGTGKDADGYIDMINLQGREGSLE